MKVWVLSPGRGVTVFVGWRVAEGTGEGVWVTVEVGTGVGVGVANGWTQALRRVNSKMEAERRR